MHSKKKDFSALLVSACFFIYIIAMNLTGVPAKAKSRSAEKNTIEQQIKNIRRYAGTVLSVQRYKHSVRVAELSEKMCGIYGIADARRGYLAGIAHDICKETDDEQLIGYSMRDGNPISVLEAEHPSLLHGRAAAIVLKEKFGVTDKDVLEAVANHTFGKRGCSKLAKILFAADKIEPGREHSTETYILQKLSMPLDALVKSIISENIDYLKSKGKTVSPITSDFLSSL